LNPVDRSLKAPGFKSLLSNATCTAYVSVFWLGRSYSRWDYAVGLHKLNAVDPQLESRMVSNLEPIK
jgi:hypothetical protein